jgi:putative chitinase
MAGNPEKLANRVYANKIGNGDEASGDGWRYRGRGLIQVTGRANYLAFEKHTGIPALSQPDLLSQPRYAVWSACLFWHDVKGNAFADMRDIRGLTERINAKRLHVDQRIRQTEIARRSLRLALGLPSW